MTRSVSRWALLLGCLLFAVLGQFYFAKRPENFWDGALFYAVAAGCLLALARAPRAPAAPQAAVASRTREEWLRLGLTVAGLLLGGMAVLRLRTPQPDYWPIFWMWVAGMALCLAATLPRPADGLSGLRASLAAMRWEPLIVLALFAFALALRAWRVDSIPWTLSGDEGNFGRWAREALDGRITNMFSTGHLSMPSLYAFFQAAWLKLAGDNMVGLRLPWAVTGALSVLGTYMLVRRLFGRNMAVLTALLVAGYSYHIHYSRLGLNNIADPFFVVWALYFLVLGYQSSEGGRGRAWPWMVAGLLSGLAFYFYTGGRQVIAILLGVIVWAALTDREFLARAKPGLIALVIGFVVSVGPMALYATQHPDDFNARMNQVGILQTGWLDNEAQGRGVSKAVVLAEQFRQVFFGFTTFLDRTDFYRPGRPLLDFPAAILFLLGVVLSVARFVDRGATTANTKDSEPGRGDPAPTGQLGDASGRGEPGRGDPAPTGHVVDVRCRGEVSSPPCPRPAYPPWRYAVFVIWFFAVIVAGGVLTVDQPASQRIVSSAIPAMFFVAVALREIVRAFGALTGLPRAGRYAVALAVAALLVVSSVRFYFGPYQQSMVYGSFNAEVSTAIGYYMEQLGPDWKQYFMGAPRMWAEFGSATFISKNPYLDVIDPVTGPPAFVDPSYNAAFIILPDRRAELDVIQQAYPGGKLEEIHRGGKADEPLLFIAYTVNTKSSG